MNAVRQAILLELRQEMRLDQVLEMVQVQRMDTAGTGDARRQAQILRRLIRQIDARRFADPRQFVKRVFARLRRSTEDARQVLAPLVETARALDPPDLEAVKSLLGYGILAFQKRSGVPAVEYEESARVFGARREPATNAAIFDFLSEDLLERKERSNWAHLITALALEGRLDDPTFLSVAKRLDTVPGRIFKIGTRIRPARRFRPLGESLSPPASESDQPGSVAFFATPRRT